LDLSDGSLIDHDSISNNGFEELIIEDNLFYDQDKYFKEYIDLIGELSIDNNTKEWWSSELASKNRFSSQLPELLFNYLKCVHVIKKESFDIILILYTDPILLNPLRKLSKKVGLRTFSIGSYLFPFNFSYFIYLTQPIINVKTKIITSIRSIKSVFHQYLVLSKRMLYVRRNYNQQQIDKLNDEKYFLVKTFISKVSFDKNGKFLDVFFGQLPSYLQARKKVVTLVHMVGDYKHLIKKINKLEDNVLIPYEYFLSFRDIVWSLIKILFWRFRIRSAFFQGHDVSEIIKLELKRSGIALDQYVYYYCIKNLLKRISIDRCFLTYENIAWENIFILAFRDFSPETRIIGSQHAVIPLSAAGMFISKSDCRIKPFPDRLLTTGEAPKNILLKYGCYAEDMIVASCALRFDYLSGIKGRKRNRNGNILLALEGIHDVHNMVNYTLRELSDNEKLNLIIRTHPLLPWEKLKSRISCDINELTHVSISENRNILDDLADADVCIYWGSTVALEALSMGVPVIHFKMDTIMNYDPLFELEDLKWVVRKGDSLEKVIMQINGLSDVEYQYQAGQAQQYIGRYFHPVTEENLKKFLYS